MKNPQIPRLVHWTLLPLDTHTLCGLKDTPNNPQDPLEVWNYYWEKPFIIILEDKIVVHFYNHPVPPENRRTFCEDCEKKLLVHIRLQELAA